MDSQTDPAPSTITVICDKMAVFLGFIVINLMTVFSILLTPFFIVYYLIVLLLKRLRPDLETIILGSTAIFCNDYFATTPPRSNIIITLIFEGNLTWAMVKNRILDKWILARDPSTGHRIYEKFLQYPVRWMGYNFWRKAERNFCINDHVLKLRDYSNPVSKMDLNSFVETLINSRIQLAKSPWEVYVIENYKPEPDSMPQSVLLVKIHHCLTDGAGLFASIEALFGRTPGSGIKTPELPPSSRSMWQTLSSLPSFMSNVFYLFSYHFRSSPWKVPDSKKVWYQVCAKSEPIPVQQIKNIKNRTGVSFTSVLLSAAASAGSKIMDLRGTFPANGSIMCMNILPTLDRFVQRSILTNYYTAVVLEVPMEGNLGAVERLKKINTNLESMKKSLFPLLFQRGMTIVGCLCNPFVEMITKNRAVSIGLTNFAGITAAYFDRDVRLIHSDSILGGFSGQAGVCVSVLGNESEVSIQVCCENAVMSKQQAWHFVRCIVDEIQFLTRCSSVQNLGNKYCDLKADK